MYILAFDSTAKVAAVALLEYDRPVASYQIDAGLTQSELLLPMAEHILSSLSLSFYDIGLFAVSAGPGSFTGVRIGAALVKGLAFGKNIPCVPVSAPEALAENVASLPGILLPAMDARRSQVYTATFRSEGNFPVRLTPDRAVSVDALTEEFRDTKEPVIPVGDGAPLLLRAFRAAKIPCIEPPTILMQENAVSVGRVAYRKYLAGEWVSDEALRPTYLRLPQAERERLAKEGKNDG